MCSRRLLIVALIALLQLGGCLARSYPLEPGKLVAIPPAEVEQQGERVDTREWTRITHLKLASLLPGRAPKAINGDLLRREDGRPMLLSDLFSCNPRHADSLVCNMGALLYIAKVLPVDEPRGKLAEWEGFERISIPMADGVSLSAVLGRATGKPVDGSYIVMCHGLFGRQYGDDQHNMANALRAFGHNVVALEMRGHGRTEIDRPDVPMTFGLDEAIDLISVDRYLRSQRKARRVGLVAWSLTSQQGLLAAWVDSDKSLADSQAPVFAAMPRPNAQPAFDSGMLLISPALNLVEACDEMQRPQRFVSSPLRATFQQRAAQRLKEQGQKPTRDISVYLRYELERSRWRALYPDYASLLADTTYFIDFTGQNYRRLESVRVPVVVVQSADDPLEGAAQAAINCFSQLRNRNCSLVMTRSGGHASLTAASAPYEYSLMQSFFDPTTGPRAVTTAR